MAKDDPGAITPAAAVARHLEWLVFALEAARDEEQRRRGRLERATDKNRGKRTVRLGEVAAEIRELSALVDGLRDLQVRAGSAAVATVRRSGSSRKASAGTAATTTRRSAPKSTGSNGTGPATTAVKAAAPKAGPAKATPKPSPKPRRQATKRTSSPST